mgnify:CR=1 FL=1
MFERKITRQISVGKVKIGGDAPISIQSMTNTHTEDVEATVTQIKELEKSGCDIIRSTANNEEAAKAFEGVSLTIPVKVSPTGTIYGSVGANQVHEALLAAGHNVDRKIVSVHESIKTPGKYTGIVRLHKEVAVEIPFEVVAENAEELAAAFHQFYTKVHVLTDDERTTCARLYVCDCVRRTLENALGLLGVSAPERM